MGKYPLPISSQDLVRLLQRENDYLRRELFETIQLKNQQALMILHLEAGNPIVTTSDQRIPEGDIFVPYQDATTLALRGYKLGFTEARSYSQALTNLKELSGALHAIALCSNGVDTQRVYLNAYNEFVTAASNFDIEIRKLQNNNKVNIDQEQLNEVTAYCVKIAKLSQIYLSVKKTDSKAAQRQIRQYIATLNNAVAKLYVVSNADFRGRKRKRSLEWLIQEWEQYEQQNGCPEARIVRDALLNRIATRHTFKDGWKQNSNLTREQKTAFRSLTSKTAQTDPSGYRYDLFGR